MARTVSQAFQEFMRRYEPSPWQRDIIATHHNYIRGVIANKIDIVDDFLTGSYVKQTQIKPITDVDLFIVIDLKYSKSYYPKMAIKLLNDFKKLLQETYQNSSLKTDGQSIVKTFSDGFKMDVVPAFLRQDGVYLIPNAKNNSWIQTNPKQYNAFLSHANQSLEGKLIPIIKIIKCWNILWRNFLKSLHIEILALNCFCDFSRMECYPFVNFQEGLEIFFRKVESLIINRAYDPIIGDQIDKYLDKHPLKRKFLATLFQKHHILITKAIEYEYKGYQKQAITIWKMLFKGYFPAYY